MARVILHAASSATGARKAYSFARRFAIFATLLNGPANAAEIAGRTDCAKQWVHGVLRSLERRGAVRRAPRPRRVPGAKTIFFVLNAPAVNCDFPPQFAAKGAYDRAVMDRDL